MRNFRYFFVYRHYIDNESSKYYYTLNLFPATLKEKVKKQAGTELGQAQLKLGLDFTLIFCRFGGGGGW